MTRNNYPCKCGRRLTHPVSLFYGLGLIYGEHFHISLCGIKEELKNVMIKWLKNRKIRDLFSSIRYSQK
jgi:hypothetical protein